MAMVGFETPYPVAMVGFETLYPGAIIGLNHPAHGNGWI
jgi:hypothetical protein